MSDDWNNSQQTNDYHQGSQYQPHQEQTWSNHSVDQQGFQPQPSFQPEHEPIVQAPAPDLSRLDAVEAAIRDLRAHIDEMKAALHAQAEARVAPVPEHVETSVPVDAHADRLTAIEAEIGSVKALVTTLTQNLADIHADVKTNAALHDETRGIVDEQHQLMRGLNYIITSAIGTLTSSAKTVK